MGDRAQVTIADTGVKLYSHWGGQTVVDDVLNALDRARDRWDDPPYLARVIFDEMKGDDTDGTTGYGISTVDTDARMTVTVDCAKQVVTVREWGDFHSEGSFDEFVGAEATA